MSAPAPRQPKPRHYDGSRCTWAGAIT